MFRRSGHRFAEKEHAPCKNLRPFPCYSSIGRNSVRSEMAVERQRIDKWLWHARVVRTRTSAALLVDEGHVRLDGARVDAASRPLKVGDVVTVALDRTVRVMKVTGFADR